MDLQAGEPFGLEYLILATSPSCCLCNEDWSGADFWAAAYRGSWIYKQGTWNSCSPQQHRAKARSDSFGGRHWPHSQFCDQCRHRPQVCLSRWQEENSTAPGGRGFRQEVL